MKELAISATVFITIILSLAFGIGLSYTCMIGILRLMGGHSAQTESAELKPATVSGD